MDAGEMDMPTDLQTACDVLMECYDEGAGAEALLRAFIAERDYKAVDAQFWVGVYRLIVRQSPSDQYRPHGSLRE